VFNSNDLSNRQYMKLALVITTINPTAEYLIDNVKLFKEENHSCYIILDRKNQGNNIDGYISFRDEPQCEFERLVPFDSYSRKNIGYIRAFKNGENVFETDDDNLIIVPIRQINERLSNCSEMAIESDTGNLFSEVYKQNGTSFWARGLPITYRDRNLQHDNKISKRVAVTQFMVSKCPDLDAIYRLVMPAHSSFEVINDKLPLSLFNTFHPFNSQGTLWRREFLPLAYLPAYCEFRMTDIWRGYIAQHILYTHNFAVRFDKEGLVQIRNVHDISVDFFGEHEGYKQSQLVIDILSKVKKDTFNNMMIDAYKHLIIENIIKDKRELILLKSYLNEFS
jgi:hypothetical protein